MILDNSPIEGYKLQEKEVYAICECPLSNLLRVHVEDNYKFQVSILDYAYKKKKLTIKKDSFPIGWDNYHYKISLLADRFLKGEKNLLY